jgi:Rieske Fe-S protein
MAKDPHMSRNDFVKVVVGGVGAIMGAALAWPAVRYVIEPALQPQEGDAWISAGPLENYPIGVPTLFIFTRTRINGWEKTTNSYGVYILQKSAGEITALSNVCTHLGCKVKWSEEAQLYPCPCHDAHFNIEGAVESGPPPRPLDPYETKIEEGIIYVHYMES